MEKTFAPGQVRFINARNLQFAQKLIRTFHALYVKNAHYSKHVEGEIYAINMEEAARVGANYMLSAKSGELYALVPVFYYTRRPLLAFLEHSVPNKYQTMYFICNYSQSTENRKGLQATFLFCEAKTYKKAYQQLAKIFTTITGMDPYHQDGLTLIPFDAVTAIFGIYDNMGVDVPAPIRYCEYAFLELAKTKIKDVILFLEA